ncbi:leucine--tRNA ligase, mitochondrial isoform X1 [Athalia rosae]|uniref:leucine--tRNA ligase, mitochondrial isoform X1 n=2 Tax=Athalia rosae TaxID=37344 RepID=UPI0020342B2B|nr:leucine--tRNA ligase, mitochondrial isoform X1 [Athalia rosae]XP_012267574.2 leucine--tRNA ligase, mitochondrial isoform X1 [Athalia rosae]XP_012267576.2 leucine--tRNA ligase, mitochondrial isoform X1 [Athalia rosae]XP_048509881.1 leucine--tRNA ligase, mitochondrial isoform X1 [Athalia rosae]
MTYRYTALYPLKTVAGIVAETFFKRISARLASTGLNLWDHELSPEIKHKIENHWKGRLGASEFDENDSTKEKFYVLSMFPYPSGQLHMGHIRVYSISDSVARFYRMRGKNVLHPMGWDAFGLPAENAAVERGLDPTVWTKQNIDKMREQFEKLGCSFDWSCELATCNPDYYRWTQELFLHLFHDGLIYRKEALVNWDPVDHTVLADEQVDAQGHSWRSGAKVEKKFLDQWFVRTTAFAKSLYDGLSDPMLKGWRDVIKLQEHWIGECNGLAIDFQLISEDSRYPRTLPLWTDKPELIESAEFVAVAPCSFLGNIEESADTTETLRRLNVCVLNPFTNKHLPVFVTKDVEFPPFMDNHIGIPCSSEVDAELCKTVGIEFRSTNVTTSNDVDGKRREIVEKAKKWNIGRYPVSSKLKDWLISRQRYWGTPIPIVHCQLCGVQPVPSKELPVILPTPEELSKEGASSLDQAKDWLSTKCPKCGGKATRETDTMDTFVDSSWYFMRYIDSRNNKKLFSKEKAEKMLPVDLLIGGKEHAVLHLYYARFMNHFLHSKGLLPTSEPFKQLLVQGMVMGQTFRIKDTGEYLNKNEVEKRGQNQFIHKKSGKAVTCHWEKMSKSKYNGVDPMDMFTEYGTDTTRLIILADVAPTSHRNWSSATFPGIIKWQHRLWLTVKDFLQLRNELAPEQLHASPKGEKFVEQELMLFDSRNYYVRGVTLNITDTQQLSVAISKMQGLTNSIRRSSPENIAQGREYERALAAQIIMLAPLAPHFASELWAGFCSAPRLLHSKIVSEREIQWDKDVLQQNWPEVDMEYKIPLTAYVNGHKFLELKVARYVLDKTTVEEAMQIVMADDKFQKYLKVWRVVDIKFDSVSGYGATIQLSTEKISDKLEINNTQT